MNPKKKLRRYRASVSIQALDLAISRFTNSLACIVAIDQSKAFDSISRKYMNDAYKFFGQGENFIILLTTLGFGRNACISFDDGILSI